MWFFLLDGSGFALFIGLVVTLGAWEWARLAGFNEQLPRVVYAAVVALLLFLMHTLSSIVVPWVLGAAVLWWALATFLVLTYPRTSGQWSSVASKLVIGLLILLPAWQGLVEIKNSPMGNWLIMAVMVLVWGLTLVPTSPAGRSASASWRQPSARARAGKVFTVAWH